MLVLPLHVHTIIFFFPLPFVAKCAAVFKYVWGKKKKKLSQTQSVTNASNKQTNKQTNATAQHNNNHMTERTKRPKMSLLT